MRTIVRRSLTGLFVLLLSAPLAAAQETPAEKIRKVLDQPISLNFSGQDLSEVLNHLRDVTKLNIVLEHNPTIQFGGFPIGPAIQPAPAAAVEIKSNNARLHIALKKLLADHGLVYVIMQDHLLVTSQDQAVTRQLTQRTNVSVKDVPVQQAIKELVRHSPVNLVIDPRVKDAQTKVSLDVEGVTVETAVRLLAELGGIKAVRVDNVLFVTTEARAEKMGQEQPPLSPNNRQGIPNIFGGPFGGMIGVGPAPVVRPAPPPAPPQKN